MGSLGTRAGRPSSGDPSSACPPVGSREGGERFALAKPELLSRVNTTVGGNELPLDYVRLYLGARGLCFVNLLSGRFALPCCRLQLDMPSVDAEAMTTVDVEVVIAEIGAIAADATLVGSAVDLLAVLVVDRLAVSEVVLPVDLAADRPADSAGEVGVAEDSTRAVSSTDWTATITACWSPMRWRGRLVS